MNHLDLLLKKKPDRLVLTQYPELVRYVVSPSIKSIEKGGKLIGISLSAQVQMIGITIILHLMLRVITAKRSISFS